MPQKSEFSHNEFVSLNDVLKEYNDMKEAIKHPKSFVSDKFKMWLI